MATGVEIVAAMAEAWNRHDLDGVYGRMAEDYREHVNGALIRTSRDEARREDQAAIYDVVPDYRRSIDELWGADDRVVSRFTVFGTMGDGTKLRLAVACIYGITDELISEAHLFFDPAIGRQPA